MGTDNNGEPLDIDAPQDFGGWRVGDNVELAPSGYTASGKPRGGLARGWITDLDSCYGRPHAHVTFEEPFNGLPNCTASLSELTRV